MNTVFDQARSFFLSGVAHYEAGRFEAAERDFVASLALVPNRPSTLTNLGATRVQLRKFEEAEQVLAEALAQVPDDGEALAHRARACAELGRLADALESADRALALDARQPGLWTLRGNVLRETGRLPEAADSFRQAMAHGGDAQMNGYYLAALAGENVPAAPPRAYVQALFDSYADGFEHHLVDVLKYRAPDILIDRLGERRFRSVLDLGCGTGLCGARIRAQAQRVVGVDLSPNMVERARERGVYDEVVTADVVEYLRQDESRHDLVLAADVLGYLGTLEELFARVAAVLESGGRFVFTIEIAEDEARSYVLRPNLRYAHTASYIRSLAESNGFEFEATAQHPIREDQRSPVAGLFAWLVKP